jgi:hypothetical protein
MTGWRDVLAQMLALRALSRQRAVLGLLSFAFATLVVVRATQRVSDPDVFWLAAVGRDMLATGHVPVENGYSFADAHHPWVMHETLFALAYYCGLSLLGPAFFGLLVLVSAACLYGVALYLLALRAETLPAAALAGILVFTREGAFLEPRPGYVSLLFVLGMVGVAFGAGWTPLRALMAILLELVWAEAHGSFPLGIVLVVAAAFDDKRSVQDRGRWLFTAVVAAISTVMNPYGFRLHGLVDRYLRGGDETAQLIRSHIKEFLPAWRAIGGPFFDPTDVVVLVIVAALALSALSRRRCVARATVSLGLVFMACLQVRHATLAGLVGALLLLPEIDHRVKRLRPDLPAPVRPLSFLLVPVPGLMVAIALWSWAFRTRPADDWLAENLGGAPVERLARAIPDNAHVYAPFVSAGVILWLDAERGVRVFFDPRNDPYSPEVARAGFDLEQVDVSSARVDAVLTRFGADFALVPRDHPTRTALVSDQSWAVWKTDEAWTLFRRAPTGSPAP